MKIHLQIGVGEPETLLLGEIALNMDTNQLVIGDGKGGTIKEFKLVIGPYDSKLYFELDSKYYPVKIAGFDTYVPKRPIEGRFNPSSLLDKILALIGLRRV